MIRNYLAIALRNIRQNPLYSFINIFSLAIGLAACLAIYLFISDEKSFDTFHKQKASIYRIDEVQNFSGTNEQKVALSMPGMGPNMVLDFPEVATFTRFWGAKRLLKHNEDQFLLENVATVDSTFLGVFDYALLAGDRATALNEPWSILLTEETARKFFKDPVGAVGNSITMREKEYKITGILKDVPENSHLQFDGLVSMTTVTREEKEFNNRWGSNFLNTYLVLQPNTDIKSLEAKFPEFMIRHTGEKDINQFITLFLQRLDQVHLGSTDIEHDYHNYRKFNGSYLGVFSIVGGFILLIAGVNFMNLTTARASHRWKEIGVRSSVGAGKFQLFAQFIFESIMLAMLALVLALLLDAILIPFLNRLIGRQLSFLSFFAEPMGVIALMAMTILLGMITGIYPSFYMTSFKMSSVLKGGGQTERTSIFRSTLVVVQFGLAMAMIVSTLIVVQQLSFMQHTDMGFNKDQIMLVDMNRDVNEKFVTLKEELLKSRFVQGVTASGQRLGNNFHQWSFKVKTDTGILQITPSNVNVEYDYLKVYGIKLIEGREFSRDNKMDAGFAFIINESFAKELKLKETIGAPAGHSWYKDDSLGTIIGVVEDFHFNSLHHKINTLSMVVHPDWGYDEVSIKIDGANAQQAITEIKNIWSRNVTYPFNYSFLDEHFDTLYRSDQQMSSVVTIMAALAILLSCMGLFGLVTIAVAKRIKEVGIRKALGASEREITLLLSRNFMLLILVSFVVASPITYSLLTQWLEGFAYHIEINLLVFLTGGIVALAIALLTISYHTIKASRENPVKALRYE